MTEQVIEQEVELTQIEKDRDAFFDSLDTLQQKVDGPLTLGALVADGDVYSQFKNVVAQVTFEGSQPFGWSTVAANLLHLLTDLRTAGESLHIKRLIESVDVEQYADADAANEALTSLAFNDEQFLENLATFSDLVEQIYARIPADNLAGFKRFTLTQIVANRIKEQEQQQRMREMFSRMTEGREEGDHEDHDHDEEGNCVLPPAVNN